VSHQIAPQHPAVVLRSHYVHLRVLLAVAMIAVVGLTVAVVVLAINDDGRTGLSAAAPVSAPAQAAPGVRYDGGPEEGSSGIRTSNSFATSPPAGVRYDGGPEEGSSGIRTSNTVTSTPAGSRYDGGPEEGTRGLGH
jgi:hypothetical protein